MVFLAGKWQHACVLVRPSGREGKMDSQGEHEAGPGVSRSRRKKELGIKSKNGGAGTTGAPQ